MRFCLVAVLLLSTACSGGGGGDGDGDPVVPGADPGFGDGGLATVNFGGGLSGLMALARQDDGKIVGLGGTRESVAVVRVHADGSLDTSFGRDGIVQLPWGVPTNGVMKSHGLAVQPDGKILVTTRILGVYGTLGAQAFVARLLPDGDLDTTFASTGYVLSEPNRDLRSLAIAPDGKIVAGGAARLERFLADGTRDSSFGDGGVATTTVLAQDLVVQPDGKVITAGGRDLARFTASGALDLAFAGSSGIVTLAQSDDMLWSLALAPDGDILGGGARVIAPSTEPRFAITRWNANGVLDTAFGSDGIAHDNNAAGDSLAIGIGVDPDDRIVGIGYANVDGTSPGRSARFEADGTLDTSFGNGGAGALLDLVTFADPVFEPDGAITTAGAWFGSGTFASVIARTSASGGADGGFGEAGRVVIEIGGSFDRANHVALQSDGSLIVSGWAADGSGIGLVRLTSNGTHDTTFGSSGFVLLPFFSEMAYVSNSVVQPDDRIVFTGPTYSGGFAMVRLDPDGAADPTFGMDGLLRIEPVAGQEAVSRAIATGPDGSLFVAGESATGTGTTSEYAVVKLSPTGERDLSYGGSGAALSNFGAGANIATHLVLQPDGKAVTLGLSTALTLVRFDASGEIDSTFGTAGKASVPFSTEVRDPFNLLLQPDGKLVAVLGNFMAGSLVLARFDAEGQPDTTFGVDGLATYQLAGGTDYYFLQASMGAALLEDGRIVVGLAESSDAHLLQSAVLVRTLPDGSPDESLGPGGIQGMTLGRGSSAFHGITLQPNGKLLVAGRVWGDAGSSDFAVLRLLP